MNQKHLADEEGEHNNLEEIMGDGNMVMDHIMTIQSIMNTRDDGPIRSYT